jgi:hypothetical protein
LNTGLPTAFADTLSEVDEYLLVYSHTESVASC